jgi:chromosome segregation ATPase
VRNELETTKQLLSQAQHDLEVAGNKVKSLERSLAEREAYVEQLESDLTTHQTLLQRAQEESERELSTLRTRLNSAETAAADAQHDLERVKSSADRRRADGDEEAVRLQNVLADKEAALERATSTADRLQREMAETTREQQESHHKTQLALSEELAQLTLQLQQKDVQLRAGKCVV